MIRRSTDRHDTMPSEERPGRRIRSRDPQIIREDVPGTHAKA